MWSFYALNSFRYYFSLKIEMGKLESSGIRKNSTQKSTETQENEENWGNSQEKRWNPRENRNVNNVNECFLNVNEFSSRKSFGFCLLLKSEKAFQQTNWINSFILKSFLFLKFVLCFLWSSVNKNSLCAETIQMSFLSEQVSQFIRRIFKFRCFYRNKKFGLLDDYICWLAESKLFGKAGVKISIKICICLLYL